MVTQGIAIIDQNAMGEIATKAGVSELNANKQGIQWRKSINNRSFRSASISLYFNDYLAFRIFEIRSDRHSRELTSERTMYA